jgi:hypothetical protein
MSSGGTAGGGGEAVARIVPVSAAAPATVGSVLSGDGPGSNEILRGAMSVNGVRVASRDGGGTRRRPRMNTAPQIARTAMNTSVKRRVMETFLRSLDDAEAA